MSNRLIVRVLNVFVVFALLNCSSNSQMIPQDWRTPFGPEVNDIWRNSDPEKYLVTKGDYNGDGVIDTSKILIRKDGSAFGLFVFISQDNHAMKTYLLDESNDMKLFHAMGVMTVSPGLYKTACGKGYWACKSNEMQEITIPYDAVNYFMFESANSYYYLDTRVNAFTKVWISD